MGPHRIGAVALSGAVPAAARSKDLEAETIANLTRVIVPSLGRVAPTPRIPKNEVTCGRSVPTCGGFVQRR